MKFKEELMWAIRNDPVAKTLGVTLVFDSEFDGVLHLAPKSCKFYAEQLKESEGEIQTVFIRVTLSDMTDENVCPACFFYQMQRNGKGSTLLKTVEAELIVRDLFSSEEERSFAWLDLKTADLEIAFTHIEQSLHRKEIEALCPRMEKLLESHAEIGSRLSELHTTDFAKETLKAYAVKQTGETDTSMMLIGYRPAVPFGDDWPYGLFQPYLELLTERRVVLHAPAYIKALMGHQWDRERAAVFSAEVAPEDPEIRETAARLWDPDGSGPLATMDGAIKAAQAL